MIQGRAEIMDGIASTAHHMNMECSSEFRPRQITLRIYEERCDIRADFGGESLHLADVLFGPIGLYSNLR